MTASSARVPCAPSSSHDVGGAHPSSALPARGHGPATVTLVRVGLRESIPWFLTSLGFVVLVMVSLYVTGWLRLEGFDLPTPSTTLTGALPWVLFVYAIVVLGSYLRPVVAAGATRGAVLRAWLLLSATMALISVALVAVLAVAEEPFAGGRWAPAGGPASLSGVVLPLLIGCVAAMVSGGLIVFTYRSLSWWVATLLLPLTSPVAAVVLVAVYAVAETGPVRLAVAVPIVLAVVAAQTAFAVALGRSLPIRPAADSA